MWFLAWRPIQALLDRIIKVLLALTGIGAGSLFDTGEEWYISQLAKRLPKDAVLFDIGAYDGKYSRMLRRHFPHADIHAFEPVLDNYKKAWNTPVRISRLALGAEDGETTIFVPNIIGTSSLYRHETKGGLQAVEESVPMTTLDAYCKEHGITHIDFLKADIEGCEYEMFKGAKQMLPNIDIIQFEFGRTYSRVFFSDFWKLFKDRDMYRLLPRGLRPVTFYHDLLEIFATANYLAVKKLPVTPQ